MFKDILNYKISFRQLFYLAVVVGVPYFAIGVVWLATHHAHLAELNGWSKLFSTIGEVIAWPPLLFAHIELR